MATNNFLFFLQKNKWWLLGSGVLALGFLLGFYFFWHSFSNSAIADTHGGKKLNDAAVSVIHLKKETFERITVQPGTVQAFQSIHLFARASGYLKEQKADIGDLVKKGQVLAILDVPDLEKQVQHQHAVVEQTQAKVLQLKAKVNTAKAELDAVKAAVVQAEATAKSAAAWVRFREKKLNRYKDLLKTNAVPEAQVDELQEQYEAAVETELAAKSAVLTAKANVEAHASKIEQTLSDVVEGQAQVKVAKADLEKSQVMQAFATITAPWTGIITKRNFDPGDYVHGASGGTSNLPLFTIAKIDVLRVIVQIPDQHVPYVDVGDVAYVEIDAFPGGKKFAGKIARKAQSEDPKTRNMHVEIDLPNPDQKIVPGMYGRVTVILEKTVDHLSLPADCLVGKSQEGKANVFVVKEGKVCLTPVSLGLNNGTNLEILAGLQASDDVVLHPQPGLTNGKAVVLAGNH